jgi:predicted PurR-regulated permease PerM
MPPEPLPSRRTDLTRTTFAVLFMGLLIGGSLWILRPFLGPTIWATMVVVATWPLMLRIQGWAGGRRWVAVLAMSLALLLLFVVPLVLAIGTIFVNVEVIGDWIRAVAAWRPAENPPEWLRSLPIIGALLDTLWDQAAAMGLRDLLPKITPYAGDVSKWVLAEVGSIGYLVVQFLVTVCVAAVMYAVGEDFADFSRRFAHRLAGAQGVDALKLAGDAIRGVALGVGVTAVVQSALGWVGLALAGVPFAGLLTALMFMLCIAQVGPIPVLLPAAAWVLWGDGSVGWGIFLFVWAMIIGTVDNFIRPVLIRMGADLSLLLIFAGVIGGLVAFGLVGLFVGPVVLAVGLRLLEAWMDEDAPPPAPPADTSGEPPAGPAPPPPG